MQFEPHIVEETAENGVPRRNSSFLFTQRDIEIPEKGDAVCAFKRGSIIDSDHDSPLRRASSVVGEQMNFMQSKKLHPLVTQVEFDSDVSEASSSPASPSGPARILMLHGYTHSGSFFHTKTRKMREGIEAYVKKELADEYPEGIEFLYPDAPLLVPSNIPGYDGAGEENEDLRGWFDINDMDFRGLEQSFVWVVEYMRSVGHIDGVMGFSQGAAMGMMIASLCEAQITPGRLEAIANQPVSIKVEPPQGPLKFAVALSGFRGTTDRHNGFYNPMITTPSMCVVADLDTMVSEDLTLMLVGSCYAPEVIHHGGGHYVPTDKKCVNAVIDFVCNRLSSSLNSPRDSGIFRTISYN